MTATPRVTLENVAKSLEVLKEHGDYTDNGGKAFDASAAICRAAQAVIDESRIHECPGHVVCNICTALAAFDRAERGGGG